MSLQLIAGAAGPWRWRRARPRSLAADDRRHMCPAPRTPRPRAPDCATWSNTGRIPGGAHLPPLNSSLVRASLGHVALSGRLHDERGAFGFIGSMNETTTVAAAAATSRQQATFLSATCVQVVPAHVPPRSRLSPPSERPFALTTWFRRAPNRARPYSFAWRVLAPKENARTPTTTSECDQPAGHRLWGADSCAGALAPTPIYRNTWTRGRPQRSSPSVLRFSPPERLNGQRSFSIHLVPWKHADLKSEEVCST